MHMDLKKLFKVIFVDFIALLVGVLNGFLLPKFLSIESYAYIKTFALYIGYSGMFHLGFSDGMYILLGGKSINEIKKEEIKGYMIILLKILAIMSIILIMINILILKDIIFTCFILYTISFQVTLFVSLLYRATGEFNKYIIIRSILNMFNLIATLSTVFIFNSPIIYIMIQVIAYLILALIYLKKIVINKVKAKKISKNEIKLLISTGFIIMIANTVNNLFFSLDRWVVKLNFTINDFAYYSFGVSMLTLFTTLIGSITIVFYPYLAKNNGKEKIINNIKNYIILICSFAPAGYFILELIVNTYIYKYSPSLDVLGILILSIPFMTVINVVYSNLYKTSNRGRVYLKTAIVIISIAISLNIIVIILHGNSTSIAYTTLISLIIWYIYSSKHFKELKIELKEIIYLSTYIITYILIKHLYINSILKAIIFIIIMFSLILIFYKTELIEMMKFLLKRGEED